MKRRKRKKSSYFFDIVSDQEGREEIMNNLQADVLEYATAAEAAKMTMRSLGYELIDGMADSTEKTEDIAHMRRLTNRMWSIVLELNGMEGAGKKNE